MWSGRRNARTVTCIACGESLPREDAREYDKEGDRWDRDDKEFEYLCKPCFQDLANGASEDFEPLCIEAGAGSVSREEFLHRYLAAARASEDDGSGAGGGDGDDENRDGEADAGGGDTTN